MSQSLIVPAQPVGNASYERMGLLLFLKRCLHLLAAETIIGVPLPSLGGILREQKMLKGHLPRVIYHQVY